jgi:uncharacterized membrane protein YidH (DUF202 family)
MTRVFEDVVTMDYSTKNRITVGWFWIQTIIDVVKTAFQERNRVMTAQKPNLPLMLSGIAILPSLLFFSIMILKFGLGIDNFLYDTWNDHWGNPDNRPFIANIADFFIILGPAIAFTLAALPLVRVNFQHDNGTLVGTMRLKINTTSIALVSMSVLIGSAFLLYFFAENFAWAAH